MFKVKHYATIINYGHKCQMVVKTGGRVTKVPLYMYLVSQMDIENNSDVDLILAWPYSMQPIRINFYLLLIAVGAADLSFIVVS